MTDGFDCQQNTLAKKANFKLTINLRNSDNRRTENNLL
jgi:hypothetical protein